MPSIMLHEPAAVRSHALHMSDDIPREYRYVDGHLRPEDLQIMERVTSEYREMPGLALTIPQAMRLWGCDEATCRCVVTALVEVRVLRFLRDGRLVRAD